MKILVPLDGSQLAEAALPVALRMAGEGKNPIVLLTIANVHATQEPAPAESSVDPVKEARAYLESAKSHLVANVPDVETVVWSGVAGPTIVKAAERYGAEMIVMTTHGRSGRQRDMFGSVADAVLRTAPMAVLVLRPRPPGEPRA